MIQRVAVLAVVVSSALALHAQRSVAETKSWSAIKGKLATDTSLVIGVDVAAMRGTAVYGKLVESVIASEKDVSDGLALLKATCQIDPTTAITDVTIVLNEHAKGVIVIGMSGVDEAKLIACGNAIQAKDDAKKKLTARKVGAVTEYAMTGESDKLYAAWLAKDVVAFGTDPDKHALLDAALAGKAAGGELASYLGKSNPGALAWGAGAVNKGEIKGGFGTVTLQKDTLAFAGAITMKSADVGKAMLAEAQKELAKAIAEAQKEVPDLGKAMKTIKLTGSGADVVIAASAKLADLATLLPQFLKMM